MHLKEIEKSDIEIRCLKYFKEIFKIIWNKLDYDKDFNDNILIEN